MMKANRRNEEGAVLLLLIIMMSAVVLIVASLLKFNSQNIKFAAIEEEQEQALYFAEGIADYIDYQLLLDNTLASDQDVSSKMTSIEDDLEAGFPYGMAKIKTPAQGFIRKDSADGPTISIEPTGGYASIQPDSNGVMNVLITVISDDATRQLLVAYEIDAYPIAEDTTSLIKSKTLNYKE